MAGTHRSGGANKIPIEAHLQRGTFRPSRHLQPSPPPPALLSMADRRRTLKGLPPTAFRVAKGLLDAYDGWTVATLETCRSYALSCARLEGLQTDPAADLRLLHAEIRCNLNLLKGIDLETAT